MKLKFSDRCEQGTPKGVMTFRKGGEYDAVPVDDPKGHVRVTHEPRTVVRRVDGKRVPVTETNTVVPASVLEKLLAHGPVTKE